MDAWVWVLIIVAVIALIAFVAFRIIRARRRRQALRERFGPGYDRRVDTAPTRRQAEREPEGRADRGEELEVRPLSRMARQRYQAQWRSLQSRFVDRPQVAVVEADDLVTDVMRECGYPVDDLKAKSGLVSVDHPNVVQSYRAAHAIYTRMVSGDASAEDLRQAVVFYRTLFEDLVANGVRADERAGT
jgi:hypothetical protein